MQFSDVTILRWNQGVIETVKLKSALNIEQNFNEVTIITEGDTPYFNVIAKIDPSDEEAIIQVAYKYEEGKLIKIDES